MKHASLFWFVLPTAILMRLFIAFPIVSVITQSLYTAHDQVIAEVVGCGPFGCTTAQSVDQEATQALRASEPLGKFSDLDIDTDRNHLAVDEVKATWVQSDGLPDFGAALMNLPFYDALTFTLTYTAIVTPLKLILGFVFVVSYAGLQTVNQDTLEAAMNDGASRWERIRYVVIPHLLPLTTFIALIQLMDNFRVFEPIISFAAQAHATSLSIAIFSDLRGETQLLSAAAATSVLTIIGVAILLSPVLVRTYRDFGKE